MSGSESWAVRSPATRAELADGGDHGATVAGVVPSDPTDQTRRWSDDLSAAWERHRDRLFETQRHVSEWLIDQVDPQPGETILELAAGPGETGFLAAERLGAAGRLFSTDLGPGMVDAAQRGARARGLATSNAASWTPRRSTSPMTASTACSAGSG